MSKNRKFLASVCSIRFFCICLALALGFGGQPISLASADKAQQEPEGKLRDQGPTENPSYQNLLPQTEVRELRNQTGSGRHGFDDEDRSFSEDRKAENYSAMANLARAIPEFVDVPNAVRALLTSAKLSVRMRRTAQGWQPERIDGEPYLRAIFSESWIYLSKQSEFRRALDEIDYPSVRFEVDVSVSSSLAIDDRPQSRIQGNFIALNLPLKRTTAKEWMLLAAWQNAQGGAGVGLNLVGLAFYAYDAYKNRNKEDPILQKLRMSPAYKAPVKADPR